MKTKLRILMSAIDAFGHINCTLGFGELLVEAGHEVTFAHRIHYKKLADKSGVKFIPFDEKIFDGVPLDPFVGWVERNLDKFRADAIERYSGWTEEDKRAFSTSVDQFILLDKAIGKFIEDHKDSFDVIIGDFMTQFPSMVKASIPYIPLMSMNPISFYLNAPPLFSGFSVHGDKEMAEKYKKVFDDAFSEFLAKKNRWWVSHNLPPVTRERWFFDVPKYFGFYHFPQGLDYTECGPMEPKDKWFRIDASIRKPDGDSQFIVPQSIASLPGKLIFFSIGTLASSHVQLMKQLIDILSKSPHKFIVSKGAKGDEIDLPPNMWGEKYVDQLGILAVADLVITHGGNNTFLETIYYGKPLIVIPVFLDQFDNAQRAVDCGIGRRLDTWNLNEELVLNTVEEALNDENSKEKIKEIATQMRSTENRKKAVEMIENLVNDLKNNN